MAPQLSRHAIVADADPAYACLLYDHTSSHESDLRIMERWLVL